MSARNVDSALALAARGYAVFPLQPRSKLPYPGMRGFLDATTDAEQIRKWWSVPGAEESNIGLRPAPGVVVVDVDRRHGGIEALNTLTAEGKEFPSTTTIKTGDGGMHALYAAPEGLAWPKEIVKGIDLKAENGYLVAAGSTHPNGGRYELVDPRPMAPAPDWLVALGRPKNDPVTVTVVDEDEADTLPDATIAAVVAQLTPVFTEGRKHALSFAVAGWLRQRSWNQTDIVRVIEQLPSKNPRARVKDALDGYKAQNDHGWHTIRQLVGDVAAERLDAVTPNPRREGQRAGAAALVEGMAASAVTPPSVPISFPVPPMSIVNANAAASANANAIAPKGSSRQLTTAEVVDILGAGVWAGVLGYDALANRVVCLLEPPMRAQDSPGVSCIGEWTDAHTARARTWICQACGREPGKDATDAAVEIVARRRSFHPVQSYLAGLHWDRVPRIDNVLARYFGADATEYTTRVGSKTMIAAVARALQPGCKVDTMAILEGTQGIGKSRGVRALAGDHWFADTPLDLESKDAAQCLQGKWIYEIGELHSFNRTETTRIKAFVSSQSDNLRPSYGRRNQDFPRQCVFIGTTNGTEYLTDTTGNRRYWPVKCRAVDVAGLQHDRDQLWAEALLRYQANERWWLEGAEVALAEAQQADREAIDPWEQPLAAWLASATRSAFTMADVLAGALHLGAPEQTQAIATRVGKLLAQQGWRPKKVRDANTPAKFVRVYVKEAA